MTEKILNPLQETHKIQKGSTTFAFLESGDLFYAASSGCMLNGLRGNPTDGSINNIRLRIYEGAKINVIPLLGVGSESRVAFTEESVIYEGAKNSILWRVVFSLVSENEWLWSVSLKGSGHTVDLLYGQDIGVADEGAVLTNELYMAQYLGHTVLNGDNGYVVYSRQNQDCGCGNPCLQQGMCVGRAAHFSTDATQFFGLESKCAPLDLTADLHDVNYQYELSYTGLQSEKMVLNGTAEAAFYGIFTPDHPDAVRGHEHMERVAELARLAGGLNPRAACREIPRPLTGEEIISRPFTEGEIAELFPLRRLEEKEGGRLLSFFCGAHSHVVLQEKEKICERPHAVIHMNPVKTVDHRVLASTSHMCGVFMSQTAVGNTSFHKVISTVRSPLNLLKNSGLRLYIHTGGVYRLLTMPAAFEMGVSYSKWYYILGDDLLGVTVFMSADSPSVTLEAESRLGKSYDLLFAAQLLFGEHEFESPVELSVSGNTIVIDGQKSDQTHYPDLCYSIALDGGNWNVGDDRFFFADQKPRNGTLLTLKADGRSSAKFTLTGCLYGEKGLSALPDFEVEKEACEKAFSELTLGLKLTAEGNEDAEKLNETLWWYSHNAMIHFLSPHGIEQPGGAAWGTRDICQGPLEYLLAFGHFALAREVLCRVFSHQFRQNREWPQWFMFDDYPYSAGECHGDVVFWPLKALSDYIERSGDRTILDEVVPYTDFSTNLPSGEKATVLSHVRAAVDRVEKTRFVGGTALVSYAGGDWDDTLQPADPAMKEKLISSWTAALCYQAFNSLAGSLRTAAPEFSARLNGLAARIRKDFSENLIQNGVIAGFGVYENGKIRVMLHPDDASIDIHYRLIPLTRSIISEMAGKAQAEDNMELIGEHLKCPDGVRLMDRPVAYDGGVTHLFLRAEQAANVGREISLQYTHAHIRYIEACAKLGLGEEAWDSLFAVNPIKITDAVPNARTRQSNLYFSSSEGCFNDRYSYSRDFGKLRDGSVEVKGGWRLYSSGPGIYLNQLVSNILGIRILKGGIELNPVLPVSMDGLKAEINLFGKLTTLVYHHGSPVILAKKAGLTVSTPSPQNAYRRGGCTLSEANLGGMIDVYI